MKRLLPKYILDVFRAGAKRGTMKAQTLFVDISGFTSLTERLLQHGTEGAEILSIHLNAIFEPMVALVVARGGIIPHFAGDAFTAIFEMSENWETPMLRRKIEEVANIAHEIQAIFREEPVRRTKFGDFTIHVRVGLSFGEVEWGIVGEKIHTFFFKGEAIEQAAEAEHHAAPQDIIFDAPYRRFLEDNQCESVDYEVIKTKISSNFFKILPKQTRLLRGGHHVSDNVLGSPSEPTDGREAVAIDNNVAYFLPKSILEFNDKGEFRDVVSVFIAFDGIETYEQLNKFSNILIPQFQSFGGYFKELDFGDKGALAVGFWGAPVAFENNATRALEFVLHLRDELHNIGDDSVRFRIGMTSGVAYAGLIGGSMRRQYAVVGSRVNLAARLMSQAHWDCILTDKDIAANRKFLFAEKGTIKYKGFSESVKTFQLLHKKADERALFSGSMVGRATELNTLTDAALTTFGSTTNGVWADIFGEAGVGKTRLTFELRERLTKNLGAKGFFWATCPSDQILKKPFNAFVYFLKSYFSQNVENSIAENLHTFNVNFETFIQSLPKTAATEGGELRRTKTVLTALIGLHEKDSLWEQLDAKGRFENTLVALSSFFLGLAHGQPLVLELEDAHWIDDASLRFLHGFLRKMAALPIFVIVTSRYSDEGIKSYLFDNQFFKQHNINHIDIDLNTFTPEALRLFAEARLHKKVRPDLLELLWRTTNGNPFYIEQILAYFIENNLLTIIEGEWDVRDKNIKVSNSISSILTARIDRLSLLVRETVKAAAVIGREFELSVLSEVMQAHEEFRRHTGDGKAMLREQILAAERGQIWRAMNELRYIFRHALLREAVYDMQMRTQLRELHAAIGRAIEKVYAENLEERYADLAFHYEQAENAGKSKEFLRKAGDYAKRNFQNQQALTFYDRLIEKLDDEQEVNILTNILIRKGEVLQLIGKWHDSEVHFHEALFKARSNDDTLLRGRASTALGTLLMLKGSYRDAQPYLETAAQLFGQLEDPIGTMRAWGDLGNLFFRQGDYHVAKDFFNKSLHISRYYNIKINPHIVSNLGLTHMNLGNYTEGVAVHQEALRDSSQANDQSSMATLSINLGIIQFEKGDEDQALRSLESGLAISQRLGNKLLISIALGCIGNIYRVKGNFEIAEKYLLEDLQITQNLGDKQGISIANELIGRLHATKGDFMQAKIFYQESLYLCRQIGYQKGIAKTLQGLGEVFSLEKDYLDALNCFDEAISICQKMNNQLIMGQCLVEKANVLIGVGDLQTAAQSRDAAIQVADSLGNNSLHLQVNALRRKMNY